MITLIIAWLSSCKDARHPAGKKASQISEVGNKVSLYVEKHATISASGVLLETHPWRTLRPATGHRVNGPSINIDVPVVLRMVRSHPAKSASAYACGRHSPMSSPTQPIRRLLYEELIQRMRRCNFWSQTLSQFCMLDANRNVGRSKSCRASRAAYSTCISTDDAIDCSLPLLPS